MRRTSAMNHSHPGHATFLLQAANLRTGVTDHRIMALSRYKGSETFKVDAPETLPKRGSKLEHTKLKPSIKWMSWGEAACLRKVSSFAECANPLIRWRGDRDSNPGNALTFNGFQDRRIRPLCHLPGSADRTVVRFRAQAHRWQGEIQPLCSDLARMTRNPPPIEGDKPNVRVSIPKHCVYALRDDAGDRKIGNHRTLISLGDGCVEANTGDDGP